MSKNRKNEFKFGEHVKIVDSESFFDGFIGRILDKVQDFHYTGGSWCQPSTTMTIVYNHVYTVRLEKYNLTYDKNFSEGQLHKLTSIDYMKEKKNVQKR